MSDCPMTESAAHTDRQRLPSWLKRRLDSGGRAPAVRRELAHGCLHTVCEEAKCPNRSECFGRGTATFLILGNVCTRGCRFCGITKGAPSAVDPDEPERIARAAQSLGLDYVVVTSVTRDDLPDGGAEQFAAVVRALRAALPQAGIEVLIPDFQGKRSSLERVVQSGPDVLNHNIETVPRLYPTVRPDASFSRSIELLCQAKTISSGLATKSGIMVGLGETRDEVVETMYALQKGGCSILTIGQYLQPGADQVPVHTFVEPAQFAFYTERGQALGLPRVIAGPFVRSSYRARESAPRRA
jgi:lipoyl synthase